MRERGRSPISALDQTKDKSETLWVQMSWLKVVTWVFDWASWFLTSYHHHHITIPSPLFNCWLTFKLENKCRAIFLRAGTEHARNVAYQVLVTFASSERVRNWTMLCRWGKKLKLCIFLSEMYVWTCSVLCSPDYWVVYLQAIAPGCPTTSEACTYRHPAQWLNVINADVPIVWKRRKNVPMNTWRKFVWILWIEIVLFCSPSEFIYSESSVC